MANDNFLIFSGKIVAGIVGELLYFPIWWYSVGLSRLARNLYKFWRGQEKSLGFSVWLKNIFVPMYGQHDWTGRLISFLVRLVQIIVRGLALLFWLAVVVIIFFAWLALPLLLFIAIAWQFYK